MKIRFEGSANGKGVVLKVIASAGPVAQIIPISLTPDEADEIGTLLIDLAADSREVRSEEKPDGRLH